MSSRLVVWILHGHNKNIHGQRRRPKPKFSLFAVRLPKSPYSKWRGNILENHEVYVYPRVLTIQEAQSEDTSVNDFVNLEKVKVLENVPMMKISSSFIRQAVKEGKDVRYLLSEPVFNYLDEMNFYK